MRISAAIRALMLVFGVSYSLANLGCTKEDRTSPSDVAQAFLRAANEGSYSVAQEYISNSGMAALTSELGAQEGGIQGYCNRLTLRGQLEKVDVLRETKRGEGAELVVKLRYTSHIERYYELSLMRERGAWKLNVLSAHQMEEAARLVEQAKNDLAKIAVGPSGPIARALDHYKYDMGRYPDTNEGLAALLKRKEDVNDDNYKGPYLRDDKLLEDPWEQPFEYRCPGKVHVDGYDLWSKGPDTKDNSGKEGSDDIKNWIGR